MSAEACLLDGGAGIGVSEREDMSGGKDGCLTRFAINEAFPA